MLNEMAVDILFWAYLLDMAVGDPAWLPHPVVFMGRIISFSETLWRRAVRNERAAGFFFAAVLIMLAWTATWGIVRMAHHVDPVLGKGIEIILLFTCFSARTLEKAAMDVAHALKTRGIDSGRKKVALIVGRETRNLDETGVTRAAIETVAENFVDGFLSPVFFALIAGVPGAVTYKMINTMDSMVGYRNDRYRYFGTAAARIDDAANFIPARLSVLLISAAVLVLAPGKAGRALKTGFKEGRRHKSPNAGFPEAAMAGALGIRLGGPNVYHGKPVEKPFIGQGLNDPETKQIRQSCDLMLLASFFTILGAVLFLGAVRLL